MKKLSIGLFLVLSLFALGCDEGPKDCQDNILDRGNDGLYPGYQDCSEAHYPNFHDPETRWTGVYADECQGTSGEDAFACAEQVFWQVFQFETENRVQGFDTIQQITETNEANGTMSEERLAILYTRLGTLGAAIATENKDFSRGQLILPHLETAHAYEPQNAFIESWLLTVQIGQNNFLDLDSTETMDRLEVLYKTDPLIVAGAYATVGAGMPLKSGWPAKAAEIITNIEETVGCGTFCGWDALRAPYASPGGHFTYAEVMARMGDKEQAAYWLNRALSDERAETWPLRPLAQESLDNLDHFVGKFAERGEEEPVDDLFITSNSNSCMICHAPSQN